MWNNIIKYVIAFGPICLRFHEFSQTEHSSVRDHLPDRSEVMHMITVYPYEERRPHRKFAFSRKLRENVWKFFSQFDCAITKKKFRNLKKHILDNSIKLMSVEECRMKHRNECENQCPWLEQLFDIMEIEFVVQF
jgi:hypothetical protein